MTPDRWWLFYAGKVVDRICRQGVNIIDTHGAEVWNGGYIYDTVTEGWHRCDYTPVLLDDVPKELRLRVLIMS